MLIVLNHKMNLTLSEIKQYQKQMRKWKITEELVICPSMAYLSLFENSRYHLGSQNVSCYENGSDTGEVSAKQLQSLGVHYCLVGHSERRKFHQEDDNKIKEKLSQLLENDITPILCIGETQEEKKAKVTNKALESQLEILNSFSKEKIERIIIAYEPIWAIGTGIVPAIEEVEQVVSMIKTSIQDRYQVAIKVLYGGSIDTENYTRFKNIRNIDGLLIGGLSLKTEKLKQLFSK